MAQITLGQGIVSGFVSKNVLAYWIIALNVNFSDESFLIQDSDLRSSFLWNFSAVLISSEKKKFFQLLLWKLINFHSRRGS